MSDNIEMNLIKPLVATKGFDDKGIYHNTKLPDKVELVNKINELVVLQNQLGFSVAEIFKNQAKIIDILNKTLSPVE